MSEPPKQRTLTDDARATFNIASMGAHCLSTLCEVFLHEGFGCRYLGVGAAINLLLIPCWCIFWPDRNATPLLLFWAAYLLALIKARWSAARDGKPPFVHSRYRGTPILLRWFPKANERRMRFSTEPLLVIVTGALTCVCSDPVLGSLLIVAGFGHSARMCLGEAVAQAQAQDTFDAMVEQEDHADRVRRMRREWY